MKKVTDVQAIRGVVSSFLYLDIEPTEIPFIISHPIFSLSSTFIPEKGNPLNLFDEKDLEAARQHIMSIIKKSDLLGLYMIIRNPYKLTFLKYAMDDMSKEDFSHYLADAWVVMENPNQDANCPIPLIIKMFKKADKKILMTPEDYEKFINLPDEIEVYRGVAVNRNPKGISWTDNYEKAKWFANRFNNENEVGYIQKAIVKKENVLAYFNTRNEQELVCDIRKTAIERL